MNEERVTQRNFKQLRTRYGITIRDISDICNLSPSTINNFEKCKGEYTQVNARSYNSDMMIQTLQSIIDDKIFVDIAFKKEKKHMNTPKKKIERVVKKSEIDSMKFYENVKKYCALNNTSIHEFSEMCGVGPGFFSPWYCKKYPIIMLSTALKISNATGWSLEDMATGAFVSSPNKNEEPKKEEPEVPKRRFGLGPEVHQQLLEEQSREFKLPIHAYDIKYTYDQKTGEYYISYAVPVYHRQEISKEKFLELIGGK